jgi:hypothetical protein
MELGDIEEKEPIKTKTVRTAKAQAAPAARTSAAPRQSITTEKPPKSYVGNSSYMEYLSKVEKLFIDSGKTELSAFGDIAPNGLPQAETWANNDWLARTFINNHYIAGEKGTFRTKREENKWVVSYTPNDPASGDGEIGSYL